MCVKLFQYTFSPQNNHALAVNWARALCFLYTFWRCRELATFFCCSSWWLWFFVCCCLHASTRPLQGSLNYSLQSASQMTVDSGHKHSRHDTTKLKISSVTQLLQECSSFALHPPFLSFAFSSFSYGLHYCQPLRLVQPDTFILLPPSSLCFSTCSMKMFVLTFSAPPTTFCRRWKFPFNGPLPGADAPRGLPYPWAWRSWNHIFPSDTSCHTVKDQNRGFTVKAISSDTDYITSIACNRQKNIFFSFLIIPFPPLLHDFGLHFVS